MPSPRQFAWCALLLVAASSLCAQNNEQTPQIQPEGMDLGNYNLRQSLEAGWRWSDISGSQPVFDTFVNLRSGPRLFEQSLEVRSLNQHGRFFDSLSWRSWGYGGDPNDISRLRLDKNRWYDFSASFRRDENFWDYNLLANPLNPPASAPGAIPAINNSPHRFQTVRRMGDYNLLLLPQSRIRFRLAYQRNAVQGPSFTSFHAGDAVGVETVLLQPWRTLDNSYQVGADLKLLPRTSISYDQFLQLDKQETTQSDSNFSFQLTNGQPVDLGVVFNPISPCAAPLLNRAANPAVANPSCNGFLAFHRFAPQRARTPTEKLSFQSSFFKNVDLSGLLSYSSSRSTVPMLDELFQGLVLPLALAQDSLGGNAQARRVSPRAELGATWRATQRLRISESLRLTDFRVSGLAATLENDAFGNSLLAPAIVFDPAACPAPFTAAACPPHTLGSTADIANLQTASFFAQNLRSNRLDVEYDLSARLGGGLSYEYRDRDIRERGLQNEELVFLSPLPNRGLCATQPLLPDDSCLLIQSIAQSREIVIHQHTASLDLWARPLKNDALRMDFNLELLTADNFFTRLDPRQQQRYNFRLRYRPAPWASLVATARLLQRRNSTAGIHALGDDRGYTWSALLSPGEKWTLDLSYNYDRVFSRAAVCFLSSFPPQAALPCPTDPALFGQDSFYRAETHFAHANILWHPLRRLTAAAGYSVTIAGGSLLQLAPNVPTGPLRFTYHQPAASIAYALGRGISWKTEWGFYGYDEREQSAGNFGGLFGGGLLGTSSPVAPRDFRGNLATVSLRYAF